MRRIPPSVILVVMLLAAGCTSGGSQTGSLEVTSKPAGLEVRVILDGEYRGVTPLVLRNLPAGNHSLNLVSPGYKDRPELVTVNAGEMVVFSAEYPPLPTPTSATPTYPPETGTLTTPTMNPGNLPGAPSRPGSLYVTSFPSGATIYLDDQGYGTTPRLIPNLTPGSYELRLSLVGWEDYVIAVSVSPGITEKVNANLRSS